MANQPDNPWSLLSLVLYGVGAAILAIGGFVGWYIREEHKGRAEVRAAEIRAIAAREKADAEIREAEKAALRNIGTTMDALVPAFTQAIGEVKTSIAEGLKALEDGAKARHEAMLSAMRAHEEELREIHRDDMAAMVTQLHAAMIARPQPDEPPPPTVRPANHRRSRPG